MSLRFQLVALALTPGLSWAQPTVLANPGLQCFEEATTVTQAEGRFPINLRGLILEDVCAIPKAETDPQFINECLTTLKEELQSNEDLRGRLMSTPTTAQLLREFEKSPEKTFRRLIQNKNVPLELSQKSVTTLGSTQVANPMKDLFWRYQLTEIEDPSQLDRLGGFAQDQIWKFNGKVYFDNTLTPMSNQMLPIYQKINPDLTQLRFNTHLGASAFPMFDTGIEQLDREHEGREKRRFQIVVDVQQDVLFLIDYSIVEEAKIRLNSLNRYSLSGPNKLETRKVSHGGKIRSDFTYTFGCTR